MSEKIMTCCRCNCTGSCKNCSCVKAGRTCSNCLPRKLGKCANDAAAIGAHLPADPLASGLPATISSIPIHPLTQPSPSPTGSPPYLPILSSTQMASTSAPAPQTSQPGQPASITPGLLATPSCHPIHPSTQPPPSSTGLPPRPPILSSSQPPSTSIKSSASSSPSHLPPSPQPATSFTHSLPSLEAIFRVNLPSLHHVPKGARAEWARLLGDSLSSVNENLTDLDAWSKFFMLPRCILSSPIRGGRTHWRETLKLVRLHIRKWRDGDILYLWAKAIEDEVCRSRWLRKRGKKTPRHQLRRANAKHARRAVEEGQFKKAIQALSSGGLAPTSPEVMKEMLAKHPQFPRPAIPPLQCPPAPTFSVELVLKALKSFPGGSAPGPSNLRATHLKEAVLCPSPTLAAQALQALTGVVNSLAVGKAPLQWRSIFVGPHSWPARRNEEAIAQLLWVRCCVDSLPSASHALYRRRLSIFSPPYNSGWV